MLLLQTNLHLGSIERQHVVRAAVVTNKTQGGTTRGKGGKKALMYLPHKAADNGTVGGTIATNPMREDDQRVLSFRLSNRSVLQHTWVLDLVIEMTLPSMY